MNLHSTLNPPIFPVCWTVFAPVDPDAALIPADCLDVLPECLETSTDRLVGQPAVPLRHQISLQPFFGPCKESSFRKAAYVYMPLRGEAGGEFQLGFGGDYHLTLWFNGQEIYQSPENGAEAYPPSIHNHTAALRLREGENMLVVRLLCGIGGAVLALGPGNDPEADDRSILDDPFLTDPAWTSPRLATHPADKTCVTLGSRRELFVDDLLIDARAGNISLRLQHPVPREIVAEFGEAGQPWETSIAYPTLYRVDEKIHLVYSARPVPAEDESIHQFTGLMESEDGIHFTRPSLELFPHRGFQQTNIIWQGSGSHNFAPFADPCPEAPRDQRFKAVAYHPEGGGLGAYASPDGYHWRLLSPTKIIDSAISGQGFDSHNLAFYDPVEGFYVCYFRNNRDGLRRIKRATSPDFLHWTDEGEIEYDDPRIENMYINSIQPYFRAPHYYLGTPARFLSVRTKITTHPAPGISDTVLMSSRDGRHFHRWAEGFLRPSLDPEVWTDRNNFCAPGFLQLSPGELSLYWTEHFRHARPQIRRGTLRTDGFVSLHAGEEIGEILTRPLLVEGRHLEINYATSAIGSIRFEICDTRGQALPGFSLAECNTLYGNELLHQVRWRSGVATLPDLAGKAIRLRVRLQDADLYSFRFTDAGPDGS